MPRYFKTRQPRYYKRYKVRYNGNNVNVNLRSGVRGNRRMNNYIINNQLSRNLFGNRTYRFHRMCDMFYLSFDSATAAWKLQADATSALPPNCLVSAFVPNSTNTQTGYLGISIVTRLSDVLNYTEFTTLFDTYMVTGSKLVASRVQGDVAIASDNKYNPLPEIIHVNDYDDWTAPTQLTSILQYDNVRRKKLNAVSTFSRYNVPRPAMQAYKSSGTTIGYTRMQTNPWVDCQYPDVEHYSHKFIVNNLLAAASGDSQTIAFTLTTYLVFKSVR